MLQNTSLSLAEILDMSDREKELRCLELTAPAGRQLNAHSTREEILAAVGAIRGGPSRG